MKVFEPKNSRILQLMAKNKFNNKDYINDIFKELNKSEKSRKEFYSVVRFEEANMLNRFAPKVNQVIDKQIESVNYDKAYLLLEEYPTAPEVFVKMKASLQKLLKTDNIEEIKDFIKLYTQVKYNSNINSAFGKVHFYKKRYFKKQPYSITTKENPTVTEMEMAMAKRIYEYSKVDNNDCMNFIKQIPQFFVSENNYGNSNYLRNKVLPKIMNIQGELTENEKVDLEVLSTFTGILNKLTRCKKEHNLIWKEKSNLKGQTKKENIDKQR